MDSKKEKICLIIGGSRGIGFAVAQKMAQLGYTIILNARDPFQACLHLKERGYKIIELPGDITEESFIINLCEILENLGYLDSILLNYGGPPIKPFLKTTEKEWIEYFNLIVLSPLRIIKETIKYLEKSCYPRIVSITSFTTIKPLKNMIISNSLRMALVNALKTLALELADKKILINAVAPGYINTERLQDFIHKQSELLEISPDEYRKFLENNIPLKRIADPHELAEFVSFLLSNQNTYITGQHFVFDGGITIT